MGGVDGLTLELDLAPDYNVAPQTLQPVVVWDDAVGMRTLHMMFWRLLPPFCRDLKKFKLSTINAASERLMEPMWQESFLKRRCLVPVDSFIEWRRDGRNRVPFVFAMKDDALFALGGVWRHWRSFDKREQMDTFAIITVDPNELVAEKTGHDRMPLIVKRVDWERWLEPGRAERPPVDLLRPFDADQMKAWQANAKINNVRNTGPELGERIAGSVFGQQRLEL